MIINRYTIIGLCLLIVSIVGLWVLTHKRDVKITSKILPPDVKEKLIIDSLHHNITIITEKGLKVINLPNRPSSIEVMKNGKVNVMAPQFGFEHIPWIGIGYSNKLNDYIGMDFYYWKQLDLGTAFGFDRNLKIKTLDFPLIISYTVYHNTRISLGYELFGPDKQIHGLVSLRL